MKTRAKFICGSVKHYSGENREVELTPVTAGNKENDSFWKYTPAGQITLSIQNTKASDMFVPGQEYYVDFTKAEKED